MRIIKSTLDIIKSTINSGMIEKVLGESHVPARATDLPPCALYVNTRSSLKAVAQQKTAESMAESGGQFLLYQETRQSLKPVLKMTASSLIVQEDNSDATFEPYVSMRQNLKSLTSSVPSLVALLKKDYMSHCELYATSRLNLKAVDSTKPVQEKANNGFSDLYIATRQKLKPWTRDVPSLVDLLKRDYMSHSWLYASARQNLKTVDRTEQVQEKSNNGLSDLYISTRQNLKSVTSTDVPSLVDLLKKDYMSHCELYATARLNLKSVTAKLDANMEKAGLKDDSNGISDLYLATRQNLKPVDKSAGSMASATAVQDDKLYLSARQSLKPLTSASVEMQSSLELLGQHSSENLTLVL